MLKDHLGYQFIWMVHMQGSGFGEGREIDEQTFTPTPDLGLAQAELAQDMCCLFHFPYQWEFQQLLTQKNNNGKAKGNGRQDSGASRFTQEARFTRSQARKMETQQAFSQHDAREKPDAPSGPNSQP